MRRIAVGALLFVLAGCSSDTTGAVTSATTDVATTPATSSSATESPVASATGPVGGNPVNGADFCAFLTSDLAAVKAGSKAGGGSDD